jgi:FkbM family methyltransferase
MYLGRYEYATLSAIRRLLKAGDCFIDVGANIGYISAYAASLVGVGGQVHSFEPVPSYYERLAHMSSLNPSYQIYVNNCALADYRGSSTINVTSKPNIGWNTMVKGFMHEDTVREVVRTEVYRLDDYLFSHDIGNVSFVKIDTEGYELPVLRGFSHFLDRITINKFPTLLVEIAPQAYPLLQANLGELDAFLKQYSYSVWSVDSPPKLIDITALTTTTNVLCQCNS